MTTKSICKIKLHLKKEWLHCIDLKPSGICIQMMLKLFSIFAIYIILKYWFKKPNKHVFLFYSLYSKNWLNCWNAFFILCIFMCVSVDDGEWLAFMHISLTGMTEKDTVNEKLCSVLITVATDLEHSRVLVVISWFILRPPILLQNLSIKAFLSIRFTTCCYAYNNNNNIFVSHWFVLIVLMLFILCIVLFFGLWVCNKVWWWWMG